MTTRTITTEQREWAERWIAGLRDGSYPSTAGFVRKLEPQGLVAADELAALLEISNSPHVPASTVADVVHDALFNGMTVMEAIAARDLGAQP